MSVRTTMTLDDDVAAALHEEVRRTGKPLRQVVNDLLRRGAAAPTPTPKRFRVRARPLGARPGINLDDVAGLLEAVEGPTAR